MPVSEKQKQYSEKYIKNKFDEIKLRVPKGKKTIIQEYATSKGESVNSFVNRAIDKSMERDTKDGE